MANRSCAKDAVIGAIHPHVIRKFVEGVPEPVMKKAERAQAGARSPSW
ncbi:hypothetical protein PEC18_35290 [Paucibacter sp. O1-1]|nr:hypothetical protein [Paucibacter sp. O1-1]MDA3830936.1 hypothetical protein [Paucibacter sp. O1-1]